MLFLTSMGASAKDKVFFNSKSNIIGISGNYRILTYGGFTSKLVNNPIEVDMPNGNMSSASMCQKFNSQNFGKKLLDYLFMYNGYSLSLKLLEERAYSNAQNQDKECAEYGVVKKEYILKGDEAITEILKNNFIFVDIPKHEGSRKRTWYVFKVDINNETLKEVYNSWNDMNKYNQIKPKVIFVASGKYKDTTTGNSFVGTKAGAQPLLSSSTIREAFLGSEISQTIEESKQNVRQSRTSRRLIKSLSKKVPEFTVRGQIVSRAPFIANVGSNNGIRNCDRMIIYRAKQDKEGNTYSSRVATVRACGTTADSTHLYTFAGGQASYKQGDAAVLQPNRNSSYSILANYMNHSYGINITYDHRLTLSKNGMSKYIMTNFGVGIYDGYKKKLYVTNVGNLVHSPILFNVGLGYGLGFEFAHSVELVPYFMAQYEGAYFAGKKYKETPKHFTDDYSDDDSNNKKNVYANSARIPVGIKAHINILYPVQLVVGAEYVFNIKISHVSNKNPDDPDKFFYKPLNYKRSGLNLLAGLRFNF